MIDRLIVMDENKNPSCEHPATDYQRMQFTGKRLRCRTLLLECSAGTTIPQLAALHITAETSKPLQKYHVGRTVVPESSALIDSHILNRKVQAIPALGMYTARSWMGWPPLQTAL